MKELKGNYYGDINKFFNDTDVEFLRMEEVKNPKEKNKSQYFFFKNKETSEEFKVRFHFNDDNYLNVLRDKYFKETCVLHGKPGDPFDFYSRLIKKEELETSKWSLTIFQNGKFGHFYIKLSSKEETFYLTIEELTEFKDYIKNVTFTAGIFSTFQKRIKENILEIEQKEEEIDYLKRNNAKLQDKEEEFHKLISSLDEEQFASKKLIKILEEK